LRVSMSCSFKTHFTSSCGTLPSRRTSNDVGALLSSRGTTRVPRPESPHAGSTSENTQLRAARHELDALPPKNFLMFNPDLELSA